ncbi:MAG: winged helix-turn-helix domain-containing protein [Chloroflexota bacterium]
MSEKQWAAILKRLREERKETVDRAKALLKEQQEKRKGIREALQGEPRTVPEVAASTGLPSDDVLWHMMAMKKYGLIEEVELDEGYYRYRCVQEKAQ